MAKKPNVIERGAVEAEDPAGVVHRGSCEIDRTDKTITVRYKHLSETTHLRQDQEGTELAAQLLLLELAGRVPPG